MPTQILRHSRQRSPETRRTYAAVYRSFGAFLGPHATTQDLTVEAVRAYRDALERAGRSPATVAKHLSALRGLAEALGVDAQLRTVRSARVARGEPRALSHDEWARLLRMPDRRTRHGKRDLALLHLLGSAGLRRAEAANLLVGDVDERRRSSDPRLRQAIKASTAWWVTVRYGKRGRTRAIPLDDDALEAIVAWVKSRPAASSEHLLLSLPRTGQPGPLSTRDIARIVARHAASGRPARRPPLAARPAPHVLHPPRRHGSRHRGHPRARRPRRHPHHHHLHRRQRRPPRARHHRPRPARPRRAPRRHPPPHVPCGSRR